MRIQIILETRQEREKYGQAQLHDTIDDLLDTFPLATITVLGLRQETVRISKFAPDKKDG